MTGFCGSLEGASIVYGKLGLGLDPLEELQVPLSRRLLHKNFHLQVASMRNEPMDDICGRAA